MKVAEVIGAIEEFAPLGIQESWDNSGLQIGSPDADVTGILLGFDCTPSLIAEAVEKKCNLIITHHPLLFSGLKRIYPEDFTGHCVIDAIKYGINIYAAHTTADKVIAGVSGALARRLGLQNIKVLCPEDEGIGLGAVGEWSEPKGAKEALEYIKSALELPALRHSALIDTPISRVAMCGGAGASLIENAKDAGAQLYLCGDISYHHFFVSRDFMIADIGHFESEVEIVEILHGVLQKKFANFAPLIYKGKSVHNPVNYL